jgi:hypothetical protein
MSKYLYSLLVGIVSYLIEGGDAVFMGFVIGVLSTAGIEYIQAQPDEE